MYSYEKIKKTYRLSKNFLLSEFVVSSLYPELANAITLSESEVMAIELLTIRCMQPIRDNFGPIKILSGKRSAELNRAVGGSEYSDHLNASACDFLCTHETVSMNSVFEWMKTRPDRVVFRQLLYYKSQNFIHISVRTPASPGFLGSREL
jgi:zinc D-Ala-D-Ala carboxypeptidase